MESQVQFPSGLILPNYTQLICQYDPALRALWYFMDSEPRPCFTLTLLNEMRDLQDRVARYLSTSATHQDEIHYFIKASAKPGLFNLGGDLKLFVRLINQRDRDALHQYGTACIDVVYNNATHLGVPTLTTIGLVQGPALGGGFEAALAQNVLIAERHADMGFPEILFNLFPGMGAYSLLCRRIEPIRAERLMRTGNQLNAEALWEMGVVDVVAPTGQGMHAANEFMRQHSRSRNGHLAIQQVRDRAHPVSRQELDDIVGIWVDSAMRLSPRNLRMMERLVSAQDRLDMMTSGKQEAA